MKTPICARILIYKDRLAVFTGVTTEDTTAHHNIVND